MRKILLMTALVMIAATTMAGYASAASAVFDVDRDFYPYYRRLLSGTNLAFPSPNPIPAPTAIRSNTRNGWARCITSPFRTRFIRVN